MVSKTTGKIKWCVIYGQTDIRDFKSEQEALKAYPAIINYQRTEYEQSVVYRHPVWEVLKKVAANTQPLIPS